jgi:hypothetical protein
MSSIQFLKGGAHISSISRMVWLHAQSKHGMDQSSSVYRMLIFFDGQVLSLYLGWTGPDHIWSRGYTVLAPPPPIFTPLFLTSRIRQAQFGEYWKYLNPQVKERRSASFFDLGVFTIQSTLLAWYFHYKIKCKKPTYSKRKVRIRKVTDTVGTVCKVALLPR